MAAFDDQAANDFLITAPPPPIFLYIDGVRVMGEYSEVVARHRRSMFTFTQMVQAIFPGHRLPRF